LLNDIFRHSSRRHTNLTRFTTFLTFDINKKQWNKNIQVLSHALFWFGKRYGRMNGLGNDMTE